MVKDKRLSMVFLIGTKLRSNQMGRIKNKTGYSRCLWWIAFGEVGEGL
jgi:hypothetical protein